MRAPPTTMTVTVLLFAVFRETLGERRIDVPIAAGSTAEDIFRALSEREPRFAALRRFTTFAVNREVVSPDTQLRDGDELALLQPVSGGAHD